MCRIETHSFLPNEQSDRRNLARQSKPCHVRLHSPRHASFVKVFKRPTVTSRPGGGALEDVFQIMVVIAVQSADGRGLPGTHELSALETIFTAGLGLECQPDVRPQLPLGAKTKRRLQQGHE